MALSDLAVTVVLEVLSKLPSTLKSPDTQVHYSRATVIRMVHCVQRRINKLGSVEELNGTLDSWSPMIRSITEAVTAQVQKLFENTQDSIMPQTILSWLSESRVKACTNMKMALSHRVNMMTRAIAHYVVQQIPTLRDTLYCKDTDEEHVDEFDKESCDSPDCLEHRVILFLQKLFTATEETVDHLRPVCVSVAALISTLVCSIADRARQTSILVQELEELKTSGGFGPMANMLYVDYRGRFFSSLSLEAFRDPERSVQPNTSNMLADKLLGHAPRKLPRSTTHIELNQVGGATAKLQSAQKNKPKKRGIAGFFQRVFRCCYCCISKQDVDD